MKRIANWAVDLSFEEMDHAFERMTFMRSLDAQQKDRIYKKLNHYVSEFKRLHLTEIVNR